ncbi:hypothetical protein M408DRAFT_293655 [Serendipita vermifera MAFF 305830]|uniref:Uncharacterized protein n=1 Tax=Serendipita vermifera MAFF 305830 TaxID=933852 RepID=A0A0C3APT5_SERVB|nr:hypothetical protein M408DRAFT_293655 [Serendipita vermifera MAFF 305830]
MQLTFLTVALVVATQGLAAPVPQPYEIESLVARAGNPGDTPKEKFKSAVRKAARRVPAVVTDTPVRSNVATVVQNVIKAAQRPGPYSPRPNQQPRSPRGRKSKRNLLLDVEERDLEVENLVARMENPGNTPKEKFKSAVRKAARRVPAVVTDTPVRSNVVTVVQNAIKAAQKPGPYSPRPQPRGHGGRTRKRSLLIDLEERALEIDELD